MFCSISHIDINKKMALKMENLQFYKQDLKINLIPTDIPDAKGIQLVDMAYMLEISMEDLSIGEKNYLRKL